MKLIALKFSVATALFANLVSCGEEAASNGWDEFHLVEHQTRATFVLPKSYRAKKVNDDLLIFRCRYPSMEPLNPNGKPQNDDIQMYFTLLENRKSRAEGIVERASDHFDPNLPGRDFRSGTEGPYELYRHVQGKRTSQIEAVTYVFRAKDGALVDVEDSGSWSYYFVVHRKVGNDIHVQYLIAKGNGKDFVKIDEIVTTFIKGHLKESSERTDESVKRQGS